MRDGELRKDVQFELLILRRLVLQHLPAGEGQDGDRVFQKGTGEGWEDGGAV